MFFTLFGFFGGGGSPKGLVHNLPPLFKGSRMPPLPANQTSPSKLKTEMCAYGGGGDASHQPPES